MKIIKSDKPLVSVVMAVFNGEKYLSRAIKSVLSQTFSNFELIIVNDGSTDNTENIINRYLINEERIIYIKNKINLGQSKTRNIAIKNARGKYILIADSDDINIKKRIETQYNFMKLHSEIDVLGSDYYIFNQNTKIKKYIHVPNNNIENAKPPVHNPTCMIRKICFNKWGYFDSAFDNAEDTELYYRWFKMGANFYNLNQALYIYRILHGNNVSSTRIKNQVKLMLKINIIGIIKYRIRFSIKGYLYILEQFLYLVYLYLGLNKYNRE